MKLRAEDKFSIMHNLKRNAFLILACLTLWVVAFMSDAMPARAQDAGIAVVVNEDAITMADVKDRMRLIMLSSGFPDTDEIRQKLAPQIIGSLVEEQLKLQEAAREDIDVSLEEVSAGFAQLSQQNNFTAEQFQKILADAGVNIATMERQIKSQIAWGKVVQKKFRPRIVIGDSDIDAFIAHIEATKGKPEYLLAEIFIPVDKPDQEADAKSFVQNLVAQARSQKIPFSKLAQQFSRAPGAPKGGDLGWMQEDQLADELAAAVTGMEKGSVSDPVRSARGYHLLLLRDVRIITDESIPSREQVEEILGIQRLERAQARHLLDLKSAAFIESRV